MGCTTGTWGHGHLGGIQGSMLLYHAASACALASIFAAARKGRALKGDGPKSDGAGLEGKKILPIFEAEFFCPTFFCPFSVPLFGRRRLWGF